MEDKTMNQMNHDKSKKDLENQEIELDDLDETKKKLKQEEIFQLFFGTKEQLSQLSDIYKNAYETKDIETLRVFFPNIKAKKDLSNYPKEVEVLNDGNVATVVDKNMPQDEKDKYMEILKKVNKLNLFHSDNLGKFIKYAKKNGVNAGLVQHNFVLFKLTSFYINCNIDKKLELLNGFEKEQSMGKASLMGKAKNVESESKNQNEDDEIELEDLDNDKNNNKNDNEI